MSDIEKVREALKPGATAAQVFVAREALDRIEARLRTAEERVAETAKDAEREIEDHNETLRETRFLRAEIRRLRGVLEELLEEWVALPASGDLIGCIDSLSAILTEGDAG